MKPLLVLLRIVFVGCLWSIIFIEGVRVIMLENWHFDIFWPPHWVHAWNLWSSGWIIDTAKEWAFILIIFTFIPLWLTGWIMLSLIPWGKLAWRVLMIPVNFVRSIFNPLKIVNKTPVVVKKKSYKEIRPTGPRTPIYDYNNESPAQPAVNMGTPLPIIPPSVTSNSASTDSSRNDLKKKATDARETFSHALFNLDDEDDDFELDFDSFGQSDIFAPKSKSSDKNDKSEKYNFDEDEEPERNSGKRKEEDTRRRKDDDYKPHRSRYEEDDDDDDYRYDKSRRRKYEEDDDYRPRRRDEKDYNENRETRENRKDNRREDSKNKNKESAKPVKDNNKNNGDIGRGNPVADVLTQKGYKLLSGVSIKNTLIDFVGISADKIYLCLIDKEPGDWLADEERFNDEEPLWFSENSHRISPVRKVDLARQALLGKLDDTETNFEVKAFVIIQMGNIINAEDMFEIWEELGVEVTRINRGMPKEIKLFSKTVDEAEEKADKNCIETVKKIIRSI